ncbi:unnamed protein product, partial [Medioppia subpectinata]
VELMAGATKDEGLILTLMLYPEMQTEMTEHQLREIVIKLSNEFHNINVDKVCGHYLKGVDKTNSSQLKAALNALYGDLVMTCPTYLFAKRFATNGQNVYFYRFNFQSQFYGNIFGNTGDAVCHGADLAFVYGFPLRHPQLFSETEYDFSIDVMKMWTDFAKNGKPHDVWPQLWDKSVIRVKDLNPNDMSLILDNPYESTCDGIWSQYF